MIAARLNNTTPPKRPALRLVESRPAPKAEQWMDAVTRESHVKMIRHLTKRYSLQILVDQATFGKGAVDQLEDADLAALLGNLHRARECAEEGISLEDAGLIVPKFHNQPEVM